MQRQQKISGNQPKEQGSSGDVVAAPINGKKPAGSGKSERLEQLQLFPA